MSGFALALLVMDQEAVSVPEMVGLKVTEAVQLEDAARLEPQFEDALKSAALAPEIAPEVRVTELEVLLDTLMDCAVLDDPIVTLPKDKLVGEAETLPVVPPAPSPLRETCWGLEGSLSVKVRLAVRVPETVGRKTTEIVQLVAAAKVEPQAFLEMAKSPGSAPVSRMPLMLMEVVPELVNVAVFAAPVCPMATVAQEMDVGDTEVEPAEPVPESATVSAVVLLLLVIDQDADSEPMIEGVNVTDAVQVADAASDDPQVVDCAKSEVLDPEIAGTVRETALEVVLDTVMV